jgi:hypothetical protein
LQTIWGVSLVPVIAREVMPTSIMWHGGTPHCTTVVLQNNLLRVCVNTMESPNSLSHIWLGCFMTSKTFHFRDMTEINARLAFFQSCATCCFSACRTETNARLALSVMFHVLQL